MQILNSFFGIIFILAIIACGLAWMSSRHAGSELLKRVGLSALLFTIGIMLIPTPGTGLLAGGIGIVAAFSILLAAIVALFNLHAVGNILRTLGIGGVLVIIVSRL